MVRVTSRASGGVDEHFFRRYRKLRDEEDAAVEEFERVYEAANQPGRVEPVLSRLRGSDDMGSSGSASVEDAIAEVSSVIDIDEFRSVSMSVVSRLVPCDVCSYNEIDPELDHYLGRLTPADSRMPDDWEATFSRLAQQNPLVAHYAETGDGRALRISDFMSQSEFRATDIYREFYSQVPVEYQAAVTLPTRQPLVIGIALNRADRDFTNQECGRLDALRPHLAISYRNAALLTDLRRDLDVALRELASVGRSLVKVGPRGLDALDPVADEWLAEYFGRSDPLPVDLADWLRSGGSGDFVARNDERSLRLRLLPPVPGLGGRLLVVHEYGPPDLSVLAGPDLTGRESEVLLGLVAGRSNDQIADRLGIATETVKKHLTSVYRKMGVSTRTEAALHAVELLGRRPWPDP